MIQYDRLLRLADFLDTLPPERFNFDRWASSSLDEGKGLSFESSCGTTACAFGWATAMPEFQALGLRLRKNRYGIVAVTLEETGLDFDPWTTSQRAASQVFGLDSEEVEHLFTPTNDYEEDEYEDGVPELYGSDGRLVKTATAKQVAEHIREFVRSERCSTAQ